MSDGQSSFYTPFNRKVYTSDVLDVIAHWSGETGEPDRENRRRREGIRVFNNGFIEQVLSKAHPVMPIVWTGFFIGLGLWRTATGSHLARDLGLVTLGVLLWTLVEYLLHRFVFHWEPKGERGRMWAFFVHGYHHEFPDDRMRLVAPPLMLIFFGVLVGFGYYGLFGPGLWAQVFAGTCVGYVAYDWIHFYTHHATPRNPVGKWLRTYHLRHHFQANGQRYGISTPLWDVVFGTYRPIDR